MTASVNQHGKVQAIGGVNEKIEGFFDICKARPVAARLAQFCARRDEFDAGSRRRNGNAGSRGQDSDDGLQ